jgi:hypothetical protein
LRNSRAANTFFGKYGYLPGDIPAGPAAQFGFAARGPYPGQGDGNGVLQGNYNNSSVGAVGSQNVTGETAMFWVDLSTANLIEGGFNNATASAPQFNLAVGTVPGVAGYLPQAKIGQNYVYVWGGGASDTPVLDWGSGNYFGLSAVNSIFAGTVVGPEGLTVAQANAIDTKIDDGLPQSGRVITVFLSRLYNGTLYNYTMWAGTGATLTYTTNNAPYTTATPGSASTCFDNSSAASGTPGVTGAAQHYSLEISGGSNVNCALSFRMQAGD